MLSETAVSGTRLRAPERLLTQLHYEEAVQEAEHFPRITTDQLQNALEAFARQEQEMDLSSDVVEEIVREEEWRRESCIKFHFPLSNFQSNQ